MTLLNYPVCTKQTVQYDFLYMVNMIVYVYLHPNATLKTDVMINVGTIHHTQMLVNLKPDSSSLQCMTSRAESNGLHTFNPSTSALTTSNDPEILSQHRTTSVDVLKNSNVGEIHHNQMLVNSKHDSSSLQWMTNRAESNGLHTFNPSTSALTTSNDPEILSRHRTTSVDILKNLKFEVKCQDGVEF